MDNVNLLSALAECRKKLVLSKTGNNSYHGSEYYELEEILRVLRQADEYGILFVQYLDEPFVGTRITHKETGETIEGKTELPPGKYQERAAGVTYFRRIHLVTMFGLSEPDDDGNFDVAGASSPADGQGAGAGVPSTASAPFTPASLKQALSRCDTIQKVEAIQRNSYTRKGISPSEQELAIFNQRKDQLKREALDANEL